MEFEKFEKIQVAKKLLANILAWEKLADDNDDNRHNLSTSQKMEWEGEVDRMSRDLYTLAEKEITDWDVSCQISSLTYQGERNVDLSTHLKYKNYTEKDWMLTFIELYGGYDGDHHKTWVLDQCARIAKGTPVTLKIARWSTGTENERFGLGDPSKEYLEWVIDMCDGEDGAMTYDYDEGVAP